MFKRSDERKSTRLQGYDYSQNGYYFVTICVDDMEHRFGFVKNGKMVLNKFGKIAQQCLNDLPNNYISCILDETIIMPNHIHCIIIIDNENQPTANASNNKCRGRFPFVPKTTKPQFDQQKQIMEHIKKMSSQKSLINGMYEHVFKQGTNGNRPLRVIKKYRLGEMIRSFKANFTRQIKQIHPNTIFKWQRSFNDHIIRNEKELYAIRKYIRDNPMNW